MLRRAKPLLGTLVELACAADEEPSPKEALPDALLAASAAGFAVVGRIHALMSWHKASSDLFRFNGAPPGQWVRVAPETLAVFAFALQLSQQTQGIFDVCATGASGSWRDLEVDPVNQGLRKHAPLNADLGGIAKGYAVDAAVGALRQAGVRRGWVNAGGDLRAFGDIEIPLRVRTPRNLSETVPCTTLRNRAAATSACYLASNASAAIHLRHGVNRQAVASGKSWTVAAPNCMAADALTKLVAATGDAQHPVLAHYAAQAWIF